MREGQILDSINSGFLTLRPDLTVGFWNRWLEHSTSIKRDDIIDRNIFEFFPDLENPAFMRNIKSVLRIGTHSYFSQKIHGYLLKMDNPIPGNDMFKHMQQNCSMGPLRNDDNAISDMFIIINDVTDISTMEVELRRTNKQFSAIIDDQTELICRFSPDGILTFVNDSFCRYISRPREAIIGTSAFVFIYKGDWRMMIKQLRDLSPANPITNIEFRIVLQETGETRWQNWTGKAFFDTNGKMIECQAVGRDITRQKLAEDELKRNKEVLERKVDERAHDLKKSEAMYRNLFNTSRDGLVIVDSDGTIKDANPKFLELAGYRSDELNSISYDKLVPGVGLSVQSEIIQSQVLQRGYSDIYEIELIGKGGLLFPASIRSYDISSDEDLIIHNVRDITKSIADKKERAQILRELERKVKHFKCLYIVLASISISDGIEETFNDTMDILKDSVQYPEIACVKMTLGDLICQSPDYKKTPWEISSKIAVEGMPPGNIEINYLKTPLSDTTKAFSQEEKELLHIVSMIISEDIEHRNAMDVNIAYHETLKAMTQRLENVEESERTKIANELHDQIGQKLAFLKISIGRLKRDLPGDNGLDFKSIVSLLDEVIRDSRTLMLEISPAPLFEFGFTESITWLTDQFRDKHGFDIDLTSNLVNHDLPHDLEMPLFKAVRESLNNVVKHAKATAATVQLSKSVHSVEVLIKDNGQGFDAKKSVVFDTRKFSFGLFNIRQNINHRGGTVVIQSSPGKGTSVIIRVPCMEEDKIEHQSTSR